jgi:cell wall-associated NlpC family hydrolase
MTSPASRNRAAQIAVTGFRRLLLALAVALILTGGSAALSSVPAHAAVTAPRVSSATLGDRVLNKAETKAWHWYSYGAAGPTYFDCSGLAYWAARQLGISIPRTTGGMLAGSAHLYRISLSQIRRGDLLFFGSGHVEVNTAWYHTSFGAHHSGTQVSWRSWNGYYAPTMAMRFR